MMGSYGSERFDYVKISLEGCTLGKDCASDEDLMQVGFNFYTIAPRPNLASDDMLKIVNLTAD